MRRHGWAPTNSANLLSSPSSPTAVCVCARECACACAARVRAHACVRDVFAIYDTNI